MIERWIASLVSALLSFANVPSAVEGDGIYVFSLNHRFVVTLSCVDIVGIGLWAFIFGFVVWAYVSIEGTTLSRRKYALLSALGFAVFFVANIFRMFIEIFYVSTASASFQSYLLQWQAFEEQVGIGIMLATFCFLLLGFHFMFKKNGLARIRVEQK